MTWSLKSYPQNSLCVISRKNFCLSVSSRRRKRASAHGQQASWLSYCVTQLSRGGRHYWWHPVLSEMPTSSCTVMCLVGVVGWQEHFSQMKLLTNTGGFSFCDQVRIFGKKHWCWFFRCIWARQAECHLVPLHSREGRHPWPLTPPKLEEARERTVETNSSRCSSSKTPICRLPCGFWIVYLPCYFPCFSLWYSSGSLCSLVCCQWGKHGALNTV